MPAVVAVLHRAVLNNETSGASVASISRHHLQPSPEMVNPRSLVERCAFCTSVQPMPLNSIVIFNLLLFLFLLDFPLPIVSLVLLLTRHPIDRGLDLLFCRLSFRPVSERFRVNQRVSYRANSGHRDLMENQVTSIRKFDSSNLSTWAIVRIESYTEVVRSR